MWPLWLIPVPPQVLLLAGLLVWCWRLQRRCKRAGGHTWRDCEGGLVCTVCGQTHGTPMDLRDDENDW